MVLKNLLNEEVVKSATGENPRGELHVKKDKGGKEMFFPLSPDSILVPRKNY